MVKHKRGPWSSNEDQWLISLVHRNGPSNWVRISQEIGTRSPKQCRERYHQNLKPTLNHDPITAEEGEAIERMVADMGKRWAQIAGKLKGRSDNAVKNWWNGGQHRRKRNPERQDHRQQPITPQSSYHYPPHSHSHSHSHYSQDAVHSTQPALPPLRNFSDTAYYSQSCRPSLNPPTNSPLTLKLPHPQFSTSRPHPLEMPSYHSFSNQRRPGYETPMPSPGYSIASVDAPSLVTDTGSESRSPRMEPSPLGHGLPPMIGTREERRNSCTRYLPVSGFAGEDDDHSSQYDHFRRRASVQLPPLSRTKSTGATPSFREPNYRPERPQLLPEPARQFVQHHYLSPSASLPAGQASSLPAYHNLSLPTSQSELPTSASPSRQLPSPFARPTLSGNTNSSLTSPLQNTPRDDRMKLNHIL